MRSTRASCYPVRESPCADASIPALTVRIHRDLLAHHVIGQRGLYRLEKAVGQHEHHVPDLLLGDELGQQLLGIPAVIPCEKLPHLPHRQITLKVDHDVLSEVLDETI